jgi:2-polyprenyl-3-methyl-5-hydroxy-6-metoxy-1,4-benzoquinol methylase
VVTDLQAKDVLPEFHGNNDQLLQRVLEANKEAIETGVDASEARSQTSEQEDTMKQSNDIVARQIDIYNEVADKFGISSRAVLLDDPQTQYLRFSEIVGALDFNDRNKTLLDVGCGNAELYKYLNFRGFRGQYVGYDINDKLLAQARKRFPGVDVQRKDIMSEDIDRQFDYVVLSGLFNVNVGQSAAWVREFLEKMYGLCSGTMAFNMISTHVTFRDERMFYMDPAEMLSFCIGNLSRRTTLAHHNLPYNYTVTVYKNDSWSSVGEVLP